MDDNKAYITIDGKQYRLNMSNYATKQIAKRFGGLDKLGDIVMNRNGDTALAIEEVIWLITLLANQDIMLQNLRGKTNTPLLSPEYVELATSPKDLISFNDALTACMIEGVGRTVESEVSIKNVEAVGE